MHMRLYASTYMHAYGITYINLRASLVFRSLELGLLFIGVVSLSPPSSSLSLALTLGMDGTVRVYDAAINPAMVENRKRGIMVKVQPKITLFGHAGAVRTVCISPDSWRVVTSGDDGTLRIWDLGGTGTPQKLGHALACGGISYGPYGELVATCGFEGTLKLWDGREGLFIKDICKRDVQYIRCALSPDALRLATANEDGIIRVYDVERGEPVITQRQAFVRARAIKYSHGEGFGSPHPASSSVNSTPTTAPRKKGSKKSTGAYSISPTTPLTSEWPHAPMT